MITIQERLHEFKSLSFDDQKAELTVMLTDLKDTDEIFSRLLGVVQNNPAVDTEFLEGAYNDIITFADALMQGNKQQAAVILSSLQEKIRLLHEREAAERVKENPDGMLESELNQI